MGKDGKAPVEVRVTVDRKPYYVNTSVQVKPSQFVDGLVVQHRQAKEMNELLAQLMKRVIEEVTICNEKRKAIDVREIRRKIWAAEEEKKGLLEWMGEEIENLTLRDGTIKHYTTMFTRLKEYGGIQSWEDVTTAKIYEWDRWLRNLKRSKTDKRKIGKNTVHNYHKDFKAMLARAVKLGMIDANPYDKLRGEFKRVESDTVSYLTDGEREAFERLQPEDHLLMMTRDLFVFQLYTGMSYADTQEFDIGDYREVDGKWTNIGQRVKTGVPFVSRLLPPAVEILQKYGMKTPKICNQVYNRMLKVLGYQAGIKMTLHSHVARHTFATWMLANDAKIENVAAVLGHTNIRQTQRYAKTLAKSVMSDFDNIEQKLKTKTNEKDFDSGHAGSDSCGM